MRICYFGDFDPQYARNRVIIKGLRENGADVRLCHTSEKRFWRKVGDLKKQARLLRGQYDIVVVGYSNSRSMMLLARLLTGKKVVWDAFYSVYDSWVRDRKLVSPWSSKAAYYWLADWSSAVLADRILLDTQTHIRYFAGLFYVKENKFIKSWVGEDDSVFHPRLKPDGSQNFNVTFIGNFIPLQGIEFILDAARLLGTRPEIQFTIIGDGQTHDKMTKLARNLELHNVEFISRVPLADLPQYTAKADVCLGVFGNTKKAGLVIPNKIYQAVAMGKAVVSADTPAVRELFTDRENILLCKPASGESLAAAILELREHPALKDQIARECYNLFKRTCTPSLVGANLLEHLRQPHES